MVCGMIYERRKAMLIYMLAENPSLVQLLGILGYERLHRPTKCYAQNILCILISVSNVIFTADFRNHICFLPSREVFSLLAI